MCYTVGTMRDYKPGDLIVFKSDSYLHGSEHDDGCGQPGIITKVELRSYGRYAAHVVYPDESHDRYLYHFEELRRWEKTSEIVVHRA